MRSEIKVDEHIILKVKQKDMALEYYSLIAVQRDYLSKWLPWADEVKNIVQQEFILQDNFLKTKNGDAFETAIYFDGNLVGSLSFNEIDHQNNFAEIGYWLSKDMQGLGIVTSSVKALINFGFDELKFHKILIQVATDNVKSNSVANRLKMRKEATLSQQIKLKDGYHDLNIYSLINDV